MNAELLTAHFPRIALVPRYRVAAQPRPAPRWLRAVADVRAGEVGTALALALVVFLLLTAYYLLKVAREPLILLGGGAEVKAYASAGQALLLVAVLKGHGALAARVERMALLTIVLVFFASNLVVFSVALGAGAEVGLPFYLWVGVFSVTVLAAFWSFANDIYRPEQGRRLFAVIGAGSSLGAVAGAALGRFLVRTVGPAELMLFAAALLLLCLGLFRWVHSQVPPQSPRALDAADSVGPLSREGGFSLLLRDPYLLLIGALALLRNWVNSTGEYVLDRTLVAAAPHVVEAGESATRFIAEFKADYFSAVNVLGVVCQLFLASRVLKHLGVGGALLILPGVSLVANAAMAFLPVLALVRSVKVAENGVDYSVQNTAGNALYLVTSRDAKYKAKPVIDAFLMRAGDGLGAAAIWAGSHFGWPAQIFARVDVVLCVVWLVVAWAVHRRHTRLAASLNKGCTSGAEGPRAGAPPQPTIRLARPSVTPALPLAA
jgi:ATP:ADP antiporter, AAA family